MIICRSSELLRAYFRAIRATGGKNDRQPHLDYAACEAWSALPRRHKQKILARGRHRQTAARRRQ